MQFKRFFVAAYLRHEKEVVQVITVDYDMYTAANYYKFVKIIPNIGEQIGKLVKMLYSYGSLPEKMHIIGLGFGAHMAGATADFIFPMKVGRITGKFHPYPYFRSLDEKKKFQTYFLVTKFEYYSKFI